MDPFLAEIRILPFNFAPHGWALCNGQILSIQQNTALFSLLGTTYGGNGTSNFALPNFQGTTAIGAGQGPGLTNRQLGETGGTQSVTLSVNQIPQHNHLANGKPSGNTADPSGLVWGNPGTQRPAPNFYATTNGGSPVTMNGSALSTVGSSQTHNNLMPFLTFNFCIAMVGIFPARN